MRDATSRLRTTPDGDIVTTMDPFEATRELAEVQRQIAELPDDAFEQRYLLHRREDELRAIARSAPHALDQGRSDAELLDELRSLRARVRDIEKQRIDLVMQAGSGGPGTGEMGNLGGVKINKGIDDALGLGPIQQRLGVVKGILIDRGVEIPPTP